MDRRTFVAVMPALIMMGCAGSGTSPEKAAASGPVFSEAERKLITDYFTGECRGPARERPPQRVKPGDKLDSGQRPTRLPDPLDKKLPYLADPYTRLMLGADVILVNRNNHDILDVIPQVAY
jgi:hypothetical protein